MSLRPGRKQEQRKKDFKGIPNYDEQRRKREDQAVEIRKTKREVSLQKKRREGHSEASTSSAPSNPAQHSTEQLRNLPQLKQGVSSDDPSAQLDATRQFRKLLSIGALVHASMAPPSAWQRIIACVFLPREEPTNR